jgi:hypothetical protein
MATQTTAVEFQRHFGGSAPSATRPVEITRHGGRELVPMSADHYDCLVAAARRTHRTMEAVSAVIDTMRQADTGSEHGDLDELLADTEPRVRSSSHIHAF